MNNFEKACNLSCSDWVQSFDTDVKYQFSENFEKQMDLLRSGESKRRKFSKKTVRLLIIAAIIAAGIISVTAGPKMKEYTIERFSDHNDYAVTGNDKTEKVKNLQVNYIPDGFVLTDKNEDTFDYTYEKDDEFFTVSKMAISRNISYDNKGEHIVEHNGVEYIVNTDSDFHSVGILWNDGRFIYDVSGNLDEEEMLKIAYNVE